MRWGQLLFVCLVGCSSAKSEPIAARRMSIWGECLPKEKLDTWLGFAAKNELVVNLSLVKGEHDEAYLKEACAVADRHGARVRFWPGLSRDLGLWPNQENVDTYLAWLDELWAMSTRVCPKVLGVVVDLEMPITRIELLEKMRDEGASNAKIADFLFAGIDVAKFERARGLYAKACERAHAMGKTFSVSTLPMNADDWEDDDETVAKALWTPIEGIAWDVISFQVYRSLYDINFAPKTGEKFTPGLIASYAKSIVAKWGARGGMDLGSTGTGIGLPSGLAGASELQADIAAALAEGITADHVAIYSLEGLEGKTDAPRWVTIPAPRAAIPTKVDEEIRTTFKTLDVIGR